jgi:hypothetical protein
MHAELECQSLQRSGLIDEERRDRLARGAQRDLDAGVAGVELDRLDRQVRACLHLRLALALPIGTAAADREAAVRLPLGEEVVFPEPALIDATLERELHPPDLDTGVGQHAARDQDLGRCKVQLAELVDAHVQGLRRQFEGVWFAWRERRRPEGQHGGLAGGSRTDVAAQPSTAVRAHFALGETGRFASGDPDRPLREQ